MLSILKKAKKQLWLVLPLALLAVVFACSNESGAKDKDKPKYTFKDGQGPNGAIAVVNGKPFSEDELMGEEKLEFAEALNKIFEMRMDRVGRILLQAVYGDKAKADNMSLEEYIEKKVMKGDPKISDGDYKKFVADKKIPKEQLNDQLKERIMQYMKGQKKQEELSKLIAKLSKENTVELYFKKPDIKVNIDVGNSPSAGKKDAKVQIVEFSDFQCPFCARGADVLNQIKKAYGGKVLVAFKQFPLPMHPQAKPASEASLCVNEQSSDKFWKMHDKLFASQDKLSDEDIKKYAKEVGANMDQFNKCFDEHKFAKAVQDDMDYGSKIGVRSTPTFFVNGKLVSGAQPFEVFKQMIDEDL